MRPKPTVWCRLYKLSHEKLQTLLTAHTQYGKQVHPKLTMSKGDGQKSFRYTVEKGTWTNANCFMCVISQWAKQTLTRSYFGFFKLMKHQSAASGKAITKEQREICPLVKAYTQNALQVQLKLYHVKREIEIIYFWYNRFWWRAMAWPLHLKDMQ